MADLGNELLLGAVQRRLSAPVKVDDIDASQNSYQQDQALDKQKPVVTAKQ